MSRASTRMSSMLGTEVPELSDATFRLLRDTIESRTGITFGDDKRALLADKLAELVAAAGMSSFLEYYYALRYDDPRGEHLAALYDRLSVPETYFWRQPEQFTALAKEIAPRFFAEHPGRRLRVWCGACCTGEEPISVAIALAEAGLLESGVEIIGTDASRSMIATAIAGTYGERSFRQLPKALKDKYFESDAGGGWRPRPRLTERIIYEVASLTAPETLDRFATANVIYCRNVFIYFSDDTIRGIANRIAELMPRDGYFFVGAAESLTRLGVELELAQIADAFVYVPHGRRAEMEAVVPRGRNGKS